MFCRCCHFQVGACLQSLQQVYCNILLINLRPDSIDFFVSHPFPGPNSEGREGSKIKRKTGKTLHENVKILG